VARWSFGLGPDRCPDHRRLPDGNITLEESQHATSYLLNLPALHGSFFPTMPLLRSS